MATPAAAVGGPYYGDPQVVKVYNQNVKSLVDHDDFDAQIDAFSSVATQLMLSDLYEVYISIPAPNSTQQNVVSVLWLYGMCEQIQPAKGATARTDQTGYQATVQTRYEKLMQEIKNGNHVIPGAIRRTSNTPSVSQYTPPRVMPRPAQCPIIIADQFQHGLRTGIGGSNRCNN